MLYNLAPREPATEGWPLFNYPPPHLLVGYQYLVKTCNDYVFDSRAYSRLRYSEIKGRNYAAMRWTVIADCAYGLNTGAYHRFVNLEDFETTLQQVQQAILTDRIMADLAALRPLRGFGQGNLASIEELFDGYYRQLPVCQEDAWGLCERLRLHHAQRRDITVLQAIRKLKTAFFNFLLSGTRQQLLSSDLQPPVSLPSDCDWLDAFVERFTNPDLCSLAILQQLPAGHTIRAVIAALSLPLCLPLPNHLQGGAFVLRPRENGRAVTEEMRRRRGEVIERFIDRLPGRRRRRPPRASSPPDDELPTGEDIEQENNNSVAFRNEIRNTIAETIRLLQEELTAAARQEGFFNFTVDFYEVFLQLEAADLINEDTLRRWVMYFFIVEHIATTLNYLHHNLSLFPPAARRLEIDFAQIVMRARDNTGAVVFHRVWSEPGGSGFLTLMRRVTTDACAAIRHAGQRMEDEGDLEHLLAEMAFHEDSGDIQEVVRQTEAADVNVDSVDLSFRFRVTGPVAFSQNAEIQTLNTRVVAFATQQHTRGIPLPQHNERVTLPPAREQQWRRAQR